GAWQRGADRGGAARLLAAGGEQLRPALVLVGDREVVVDVAVFRPGPLLPAAGADGLGRVTVLHRPRAGVEQVDVLLDVEVARQPGEVVPVAHLPDHVAPVALTRLDPDRPTVVGRLQDEDLADGAVTDPPDGLAEAFIIAHAQAGDDRQALRLRPLAGGQDGADAGRVDGDGLLGEDVLAGLDRGREVDRPEVRRGAEEDDVDAAGDDLPVGVEADEAAPRRHVDPGRDRLVPREGVEALPEAVHERVAHGDELDGRVGPECLRGGPGAPAAAADESDPQHVAAGGKGVGDGPQACRGRGGPEELPSRDGRTHVRSFRSANRCNSNPWTDRWRDPASRMRPGQTRCRAGRISYRIMALPGTPPPDPAPAARRR